MNNQTRFKLTALMLGILLVCVSCICAAAEPANKDFIIEGKTLVKYTGSGGEVTVPDGVEELGENAFEDTAVKKVILPETLKEIRSYCFMNCRLLNEITLPASMTNLESSIDEGKVVWQAQVFYGNPMLEAIQVAEGNPAYKSIDGVLFTAAGKRLVYYPDGKNRGGEYAIPEGTEELGYSAFGDPAMKAIHFPATLRQLNNEGGAFRSISTLHDITVSPDNLDYYSEDGVLYDYDGTLVLYPAARDTESLSKEDFSENITGIGMCAFDGNRHLKSVEIPESVKSLGWMSFEGMHSLESIVIPETVKSISGYAFSDCGKLKKITILNPEICLPDNSDVEEELREMNKFIITDGSYQAVLCGYDNSTTQAYAEKWGLKFESLGPVPEK